MDILSPTISNRSTTTSTKVAAKNSQTGSFNDLLKGTISQSRQQPSSATPQSTHILVGEITAENRTVSELLKQHKDLNPQTWDILNADQNQNKAYDKIRPGTRIYYNPAEGSLTWKGAVDKSPLTTETLATAQPLPTLQPPQNIKEATPAGNVVQTETTKTAPPLLTQEHQELSSDTKQLINLGKIGDNNTTVSHLLKNNPQFSDQTWNLLSANINQNKPFDRIAKGTEIYLNPENMEISWNTSRQVTTLSPQVATGPANETFKPTLIAPQHSEPAENLSQAVQPFLGSPYKDINCYELLVKGLDNMDISYSGKDGLYSKLTRMALDKGMAANAYLNGEGIIKAAGSLVLSKNYGKIADWKDESTTLIKEIEPLLDNGQILSFSTQYRGHTGIVSQRDNQWTFINSGRLDNAVVSSKVNHGVGEENLNEEIRNWFKLAHSKGETLSVTLGQLEQGKIHTAANTVDSSIKRI